MGKREEGQWPCFQTHNFGADGGHNTKYGSKSGGYDGVYPEVAA